MKGQEAIIKTLNDLYVHQLQDIYYSEKQILKSLPDMIGKSTDRDLKAALQKHLQERSYTAAIAFVFIFGRGHRAPAFRILPSDFFLRTHNSEFCTARCACICKSHRLQNLDLHHRPSRHGMTQDAESAKKK